MMKTRIGLCARLVWGCRTRGSGHVPSEHVGSPVFRARGPGQDQLPSRLGAAGGELLPQPAGNRSAFWPGSRVSMEQHGHVPADQHRPGLLYVSCSSKDRFGKLGWQLLPWHQVEIYKVYGGDHEGVEPGCKLGWQARQPARLLPSLLPSTSPLALKASSTGQCDSAEKRCTEFVRVWPKWRRQRLQP